MRVRVPPYPFPFVFFSSGFSADADAKKACQEAFEEALRKFKRNADHKDILAMIFMSNKYNPEEVMKFFEGIDNIGLTTGGNITSKGEFRGDKGGITVNLIDKRQVYCETFSTSVIGKRPRDIGAMIAERYKSPFPSTIILFACPFYNISEILEGISENSEIKLSGGVASSYKDVPIYMFENGTIGSYMVGGVFLDGIDVDFRIFHSCKTVGDYFLITSSYENVIEEIEGIRAEDYILNFRLSDELLEEEVGGWYIAVPVIDENHDLYRFIPIFEVGDGKILIAGEIEVGRIAKFAYMSRSFSQEVLEKEAANLPQDVNFGLFFNCIARSFILKSNDVSIIKKNNSGLKFEISGFLSNGEIVTIIRKPVLLNYTGVLSLFSRQSVM